MKQTQATASSRTGQQLHTFCESLSQSRPLIMGILNITPDSFSDGGQFKSVQMAVDAASTMLMQGADIIDVGGESTRPGAPKVSVSEELQRVMPVIEACSAAGIPLSIDTSKPVVMQASLDAGVALLNDVNGFRAEGALEVLARAPLKPYVCVMHMLGNPTRMQVEPEYDDVVVEIRDFFQERLAAFQMVGVGPERVFLDPGFGFGKNDAHNWDLLSNLTYFLDLKAALLIGVSRKSMFGRLLDRETHQRMPASIAGALLAAQQGAKIVRVHDVVATYDALRVLDIVQASRRC